MEHQDYKTIVFNNKEKKINDEKKRETQKKISQLTNNMENVKIESDKKLGQMLSQARLAKGFIKQSDFIKELTTKTNLNISIQIYSKWESNKKIPSNEQIAKMERVLGVKLPRNKKIKISD